jgi:hypothetical protein
MALGEPYCTTGELAEQLNLADADTDPDLVRIVDVVTRNIEHHTGRQFNDAVTPSARLYRPVEYHRVDVDDFHTTTGLVVATDEENDGVYDTVWASTEFQAEPLVRSVGWPYEALRQVGYTRSFPLYGPRARVQVTARWGWAAVPAEVEQACEIRARALLARRMGGDASTFGVALGEGVAARLGGLDRDVADLLRPFRKTVVTVA